MTDSEQFEELLYRRAGREPISEDECDWLVSFANALASRERERREHNNKRHREYIASRKLSDPQFASLLNRRSYESKRRHPEKHKARTALHQALRRGKIHRQTCWCGEPGEAHHTDYSNYAQVMWLCKRHHEEIHHL